MYSEIIVWTRSNPDLAQVFGGVLGFTVALATVTFLLFRKLCAERKFRRIFVSPDLVKEAMEKHSLEFLTRMEEAVELQHSIKKTKLKLCGDLSQNESHKLLQEIEKAEEEHRAIQRAIKPLKRDFSRRYRAARGVGYSLRPGYGRVGKLALA